MTGGNGLERTGWDEMRLNMVVSPTFVGRLTRAKSDESVNARTWKHFFWNNGNWNDVRVSAWVSSSQPGLAVQRLNSLSFSLVDLPFHLIITPVYNITYIYDGLYVESQL